MAKIEKVGINHRGFSLVEVLIALGILAVGVLAVGAMQASSMRGNSTAAGITEATTIAENWLETLSGLPFNDTLLTDMTLDGANTLRNPLPPLPAPPVADMVLRPAEYQVAQGQYTVFWNIADNLAAANTKTINIIVVWNEEGAQKSVLLEGILPQL